MALSAVTVPSTRRTWVLAVLGLSVWTFLVAVFATAYVVESTSESVPAVSRWQDAGGGLAAVTLLTALAVTTSLRRRGDGVAQAALAGPLLVLVPQVALAVPVARAWRAEAPGLPLTGDDVAGGTAAVPAGVDAYAAAVTAGCVRLLPLVALVVGLGLLAARWRAGPWPLRLLALVPVVLGYVGLSRPPAPSATTPTSGVRAALQVVATGEPERLVPQLGTGCHPLVGPLCGQDLGLGPAYVYLALTLVVLTLVAAGASALARAVRPRRGRGVPSTDADAGPTGVRT